MPLREMSGSEAFLRQARRNNWQRYLQSLPGDDSSRSRASGWDLCVLTASDEAQATIMRRQLDWRRTQALLPDHTHFLVVADPDGRRIGSGGATLRLLAALYDGDGPSTAAVLPNDLAILRDQANSSHRTLIIHSGGDSRRLPHCSAIGKLFARIPHTLPDGRASTIFDEMMINLSGIGGTAPPGVLALSGDVLLVFDHLQLSFQRGGVTGVSVAAPQALGQRHGVYVTLAAHKTVEAFLHKASADVLAHWHAVDANDQLQIDTGLVWFDADTASRMAALTRNPAISALMDADEGSINLYGDLLLPLAQATQRQAYLHDQSDGRATPALRAARDAIWSHLRGTHFGVESLDPAVFFHFGTSDEYWRMVTSDEGLARLCGWSRRAEAWLSPSYAAINHDLVLINSVLGSLDHETGLANGPSLPALITDSHVDSFTWNDRAIVAGVRTQQPVSLAKDVILHQLPVEGGYVTRILGIDDDPKLHWQQPRATYFDQPWSEWLAAARLEPDELWPHVVPEERNLWNARLFALAADRDESLDLSMPLQNPANAPNGWRERWQRAGRRSLAESFAHADGRRILDEIEQVQDLVAVHSAADAILAEQAADDVARLLGGPGSAIRRSGWLVSWLERQSAFVRWRGLSALAAATGNASYEDTAFTELASVIERDVVERQHSPPRAPFTPGMERGAASARIEAAARIDFAGGWTDTPPYSLERDSYVLNAAVTLHGRMPIVVEAAWLDQPIIVLESRDIDEEIRPRYAGEVLDHRNPADPFSLAKAALALKGVVPHSAAPDTEIARLLRGLPGGIRLTTQTSIPRGSGLGTSSIMAGAVLAALDELAGIRAGAAQRFDQVLAVEQMMTTGGGWQDQVGGLVGGVKLISSAPGLPQQLRIQPMPDAAVDALRQRTFLIYTGQQRLAKNLLRHVMARWLAHDAAMVRTLEQLGEFALLMSMDLELDNIADFGTHMFDHWLHNRRMHPDCSNDYIDDLFHFIGPYAEGVKLAGAGGGGFAIVIAREGVDYALLESKLRDRYAGAPVSLWPSAISDQGLVYVESPGYAEA